MVLFRTKSGETTPYKLLETFPRHTYRRHFSKGLPTLHGASVRKVRERGLNKIMGDYPLGRCEGSSPTRVEGVLGPVSGLLRTATDVQRRWETLPSCRHEGGVKCTGRREWCSDPYTGPHLEKEGLRPGNTSLYYIRGPSFR